MTFVSTQSGQRMGGLLGQQQPTGLLDWLQSPQAQGLAQGLLQASAPSRIPVGFGQALGMGMQGAQAAQKDARQQQMEELLLELKMQQLMQKDEMTPYQKENIELQKRRLDMQEKGGSYVDENGEIVAQPQRKLSATEQKSFDKQNDVLDSLSGAKEAFQQIKGYAGKPMFSGAGAGALASADALPIIGNLIDDEKATNTKAYQNLILQGQYAKLQSTFPGAISNAEREAMEKLGALASYTPEQQQAIIANAETAINNAYARAKKRASGIATGQQYIDAAMPEAPTNQPNVIPFDEYFK